MDRRTGYRLGVALIVAVTGSVLVAGYVAATNGTDTGGLDTVSTGESVAPPSEGITVIATDSNTWLGERSSGPRASAQLVAVGSDGRLVYQNDTHTRYWDVDPVEGTNATVEYLYADHLNASACGGDTVCTRNGVERVNLTTGDVTAVYDRVTPGKHSTRWHDADRIDDDHLVVADIASDRVFVVDTETELVEWAWSAQTNFSVDESGGPYPSDWTHLNDVEVLHDGRIMVSLRNQDQVVFLDRERGLIENRTLGRDGQHDRLYEQHNPDYLPESNGGPSVLVADSENNRVVEYHRADDSWERTWQWSDARLQWPRDADRLPNGHTLITDSNGNRVLEVDERGEVIWEFDVAFPYEAERLGTGDESTGGPARRGTATTDGESGGGPGGDQNDPVNSGLGGSSGPLMNAVAYVLPLWMGTVELLALVGFCLGSLTWVVAEWRWSSLDVTVQKPIELERNR
jgi:hypothetical protein